MMTDAEVIAVAAKLINDSFIGLLSTADAQGQPYARYLGAAIVGKGIGKLYSISAKPARKLDHLAANPKVNWSFASPNYGEVVNLSGQAREVAAGKVDQAVWDRLAECASTYAMDALADESKTQFAIIETTVQTLHYLSPQHKMFAARHVTIEA